MTFFGNFVLTYDKVALISFSSRSAPRRLEDTKGAENGVGDGFGTLFLFKLVSGTLFAFFFVRYQSCPKVVREEANMKDQAQTQSRTYDMPIPKPPDEVFERFIRSTEARLVTKRFARDRRSSDRSERIEER